MTHVDELLREHSRRIPLGDVTEEEALDHIRDALRVAVAVDKPRGTPRRRSPRYVPRPVLIAALAAATAAVLALLPGSGRDTSELAPAPASAQILLQQAARTVSRQTWRPLAAGEYFYFRELGGYPGSNGPAPENPTEIQDIWVAADGFARIVQTGPDTVIPGGDVLIFHASAQQLQAERRRQRNGRHLRILSYPQKYRWVDLDYQQLIHLPSNPAALERFIEAHATGGGRRFSNIFGYIEGLLTSDPPIPPSVRAAMYHVIARLPGMRLVGPTRDALGRPGVAIGLFFRNQPGRLELIFDPRTGALLGERAVSLNAHAMDTPVGSVTDWSVIEKQGTMDSDHPPATAHESGT